MYNMIYKSFLVVIAVIIVIVCLCDNRKRETFCAVDFNNNIRFDYIHSENAPSKYNTISGILDNSIINASNVNMLADVLDTTKPQNYGMMKSSIEPEYPDYSNL